VPEDHAGYTIVLTVIDNDNGNELPECRTETDHGAYMSFLNTVDSIGAEMGNVDMAIEFVKKVTGQERETAHIMTTAILGRARHLDFAHKKD